MIYIDTSSLLKTVMKDKHSIAVIESISTESHVVITPLTNLEAVVQIKGLHLGGKQSKRRWLQMMDQFTQAIAAEPYVRRSLEISIYQIAMRQHQSTKTHCRSLDRLHLAAMEELGVRRLMTHDGRQAKAAREPGYEVVMPGVGKEI